MWYNGSTNNVVLGSAVNTPSRIHLIGDVPMNTVPHHDLNFNFYTVYALLDPRDDSIKYVGLTINPERRLARHISSRTSATPEKRTWHEELIALNITPILLPLETGMFCEMEARERESFWIKELLEAGSELFNSPSTNGGRLRSNAHVEELLRFYQDVGKFPDGVSPQMQRYYKREYPKFFRRRKRHY